MKQPKVIIIGVAAIAVILVALWAFAPRFATNEIVEVTHHRLATGPTAVAATPGPTTQLVTERYLRRQLDQKTTMLFSANPGRVILRPTRDGR